LSYHLEMDQAGGGTGPWTEVAGEAADSTALEHVVASLVAGELYHFRYRARNVHGWSEGYSPVAAILLATVPDATTAAVTSNSGLDVVVTWSTPPSDGSAPILGYRVTLKGGDALFHVESSACDGAGAHQAAILAAPRSCTIPMTALTAPAPFALGQGALVVAVVEAFNTIGFAPTSPENTAGALVQVPPAAPPAPPVRGGSTDGAQLEVQYAAVSEDGGAPIEAYGLEIDRADGNGFVEAVSASPALSALVSTGITSGQAYTVRYRARNVHGWSDAYSPVLTIVAATVPSAPTDLETAGSTSPGSTAVEITWTAPVDTGGSAITISAYRVLLRQSDGVTFSEGPSGQGCNPTAAAAIQAIVTASSCEVEMAVLRAAPYNL
jgi:hypothetical protein